MPFQRYRSLAKSEKTLRNYFKSKIIPTGMIPSVFFVCDESCLFVDDFSRFDFSKELESLYEAWLSLRNETALPNIYVYGQGYLYDIAYRAVTRRFDSLNLVPDVRVVAYGHKRRFEHQLLVSDVIIVLREGRFEPTHRITLPQLEIPVCEFLVTRKPHVSSPSVPCLSDVAS